MISEEHTVRELFRATDSGDLARVLELLTDDVHFQFGNAEPAVGHDGFAATAANLQTVVAGISHDLNTVWTVQDPHPAVICEMSVTYERQPPDAPLRERLSAARRPHRRLPHLHGHQPRPRAMSSGRRVESNVSARGTV